VYEQSPDGFSPSSEVGVPLTEELQSFCKQHGVELVSVCSWQLLPCLRHLCMCLLRMLMQLCPQHLFLAKACPWAPTNHPTTSSPQSLLQLGVQHPRLFGTGLVQDPGAPQACRNWGSHSLSGLPLSCSFPFWLGCRGPSGCNTAHPSARTAREVPPLRNTHP
jgi:hypothetical protein